MAHQDRTQDRGDLGAYDRYLRGMDTSMRQKVALTAAHLLGQGRVADMGMGSGLGSHALAALYPSLEVVGVDLDPTMVDLAAQRYRLPNLRFMAGDIAKPVFPRESLDGIFDSSVLHHVTSFGGYRYANAAEALEAQADQLRTGGILIVRDFVATEDLPVLLDLPAEDGDASGDPGSCSTAALLERLAGEFRSLAPQQGFPCESLGSVPGRADWRRYRLSLRHAAEFLLRKDYRVDWVAEVKEEYGYFTQAEFEGVFARLGLRVLASTPLRNPWILRHRWRGKAELRDLEGRPLAFPPTNYVVVGEKVPQGEGVRFRMAGPAESPGFLRMAHYRHRETGEVFDLVHRPHRTLDVVPFFEAGDEVFVLARMSYPRPIVGCREAATLDGSTLAGYVTEPLNVLQTDLPLGLTVERALEELAGLGGDRIRGFTPGTAYYPSPGGILEEVRSALVEVGPTFVQAELEPRSGFSTSGRVRAIEARQLLRAAQVGGLPDARLELNVHELLLQKGLSPGDWIGEAIDPAEGPVEPPATALTALLAGPPRRRFEQALPEASRGFLDLQAARFEELDAHGTVVAEQALEYVVPRKLSPSTVAVAPLLRRCGRILLGVDDHDLPAAQGFTGNSELLVVPAWRLPREVRDLDAAKAWVLERLEAEHGLRLGQVWELGGPYQPSPGLTPETVHPLAVEVAGIQVPQRSLHWIDLQEFQAQRHRLKDGHLKILGFRALHATGGLG